jgi:predicted oxidoreductase
MLNESLLLQVRNYWDIAGSVRQILKDLALDSLNLLLLPADGSMETIRVSSALCKLTACVKQTFVPASTMSVK